QAFVASQANARVDLLEAPPKTRDVMRQPSGDLFGLAHRARAGGRAFDEAAVFLIGETVIILDEIGAAEREFMGERGEPFRRGALRLQRRAGERATFHAGERAEPLDPLIRAAENVE